MAIAMESVMPKKQNYKYIAPSPLNNLMDSSTFTIDFTNRKFLQVGLDSENNFNVSTHIITPSRHIAVSLDFLRRIFASMGNILSFILNRPVVYKRIVFLDTDECIVTTMVYRNEPVLVIESKTKHGHRILLNRFDLLAIQNLEWSIYESAVQKSEKIQPMLLLQVDHIQIFLKNMYYTTTCPETLARLTTSPETLTAFIKNIPDDKIIDNIPKSEQCFVSQIKTHATDLLVQNLISITHGGFSNCYNQPTTSSIEECNPQSLDQINNHSLLSYSPMSPLSYPTQDENYSVITPPSPPPVAEEGLSFYDLVRVPSPINISAPKRLGRARHLHSVPTKNVKCENNF